VGLAVISLFSGADDATQTVDAKGMKFEAPASWKASPPTSRMRRAQLKVAPIEGDDYPAEMVVFAFPGGSGTVQMNIDRWKDQFKDKDGNPPKIESKKVKGKNVEVTRVEAAGDYHAPHFPGMTPEPDRANARLLVAIVTTDQVAYFIKMIGPDKTMTKIRPEFDDLLKTIQVEEN
jgi:hypothetical protein